MKLKEHDRLMAIVRNSQYIDDSGPVIALFKNKLGKVDEQRLKTLEKEISAKWQIPLWLPPNATEDLIFLVLDTYKGQPIVEDGSLHTLADLLPHFGINVKHVVKRLKIDLTASEEELVLEFRKKLKTWIKKRDKRPKKTEYNPWVILSLCEKYGNKSQVARIMAELPDNVTGNVKHNKHKVKDTDNDKFRAASKKVNNAFNRARAMIDAVTPETS